MWRGPLGPRLREVLHYSGRARDRVCGTNQLVELPLRYVLEVPNKPITHSYFIDYGLASIVAANKHKRLEVGLIGCEGITGIPIVLGNDRSPNETFIQVAGNGIRIAADKLRKAILQSRSLECALLSFAHSFMNQTASTALSNGTATLEERLARWLLMANDRLRGNEVPLTHEFLSLMLGVRRAGVTVALHYLEQRAQIRVARKQIMITDRKGLEAAANDTYYCSGGRGRSRCRRYANFLLGRGYPQWPGLLPGL
jgi:CRP-like cAMP-binding protein